MTLIEVGMRLIEFISGHNYYFWDEKTRSHLVMNVNIFFYTYQ